MKNFIKASNSQCHISDLWRHWSQRVLNENRRTVKKNHVSLLQYLWRASQISLQIPLYRNETRIKEIITFVVTTRKRSLGQGNVYTGFCLSTGGEGVCLRGRVCLGGGGMPKGDLPMGVCLQAGLHPGGFASSGSASREGVCIQGEGIYPRGLPRGVCLQGPLHLYLGEVGQNPLIFSFNHLCYISLLDKV